MKVAIQIAGLPRFSKELDHFIQVIQGYDQVDWFFYLWNDFKDPFVAPEWMTTDAEWMRSKIESVLPNKHKIGYFGFHEMPQYNVTRPLNTTPWTNLPHVWYMQLGHKLVTEKREEYEKQHGDYDLVVKTRNDISIQPGLNFTHAKQFLDQHPNSVLTTADHRLGIMGKSVSEAFAVGSSKNISTFCRLYDKLFEYNDQGVWYHPETLTAHHLAVNGIVTPMTDFYFVWRQFKHPDGKIDHGSWV